VASASDPSGAARVIAAYAPVSLSVEVAAFARSVVAQAQPANPGRAKALLFACGKLGTYATSLGLGLAPCVVLHPSFVERYIVTQGARFGPATRRTLRSNLRFVARAVVIDHPVPPVPLSRERAQAPYSDAEISAYMALALAQPTMERRMRLSGLIALGAGAGLMGADLRAVSGTDVIVRSGGLIVEVKGRRARVVPVIARFHQPLRSAARFADAGYVIGGFSAARRNVTSGLVASVAGGADLPTLNVARLRATWLASCAEAIGLKAFMAAAGINCSQRLGDLVAQLANVEETQVVALLGAPR
jgi:hypothetical protein